MPWASDATISHLIGVPDLQTLLRDLRFEPVRWEGKTDSSVALFHSVLERVQTQGWMSLGRHLLMGNDAVDKIELLLPLLDTDIQEGLASIEKAEVRFYHSGLESEE